MNYKDCFLLWLLWAVGMELLHAQSVDVTGEVTRPISITADLLAGAPRHIVALKDRNGQQRMFSGVAVQEVLALAGVTVGEQLRGDNLTKYVLVTCTDGYEVLFSLAELDSSFTNRTVILADTVDGRPLPPKMGAYRLIVPGEKKPARSAYQVSGIKVKYADPD